VYITDANGKWEIEGNVKILIEPSESYLTERELERQKQEEVELLNRLIPSDKDMLMAEVEIQTITIMMEVGLI